jgi:hypothetical protein
MPSESIEGTCLSRLPANSRIARRTIRDVKTRRSSKSIMRREFIKTLSLTLLASALAVGWETGSIRFSPGTTQAAVRAKKGTWEYKSIVKVLSYDKQLLSNSEVRGAKCFDGSTEMRCDTMLNSLGAQGWELVDVFSESLVGGNGDWAGTTTAETFIFKRTTD